MFVFKLKVLVISMKILLSMLNDLIKIDVKEYKEWLNSLISD